MLKILKIVLLSSVLKLSCWAQKDTVFLTNGTIKYGKITESDRKVFLLKTEKRKVPIRKTEIYKLIDSSGTKSTFINLNYLEKSTSKEEYYKILKPISSRHSKGSIRHYYGNVRIKEGDFRLAMKKSQDEEILKYLKKYENKFEISHLMVCLGWTTKVLGAFLVYDSKETYYSCTGKCVSYNYTNYNKLNGGLALIAAGMVEVTTGYVLGIMNRSIKQKKLINRYNSLILQP